MQNNFLKEYIQDKFGTLQNNFLKEYIQDKFLTMFVH